MRKTSYLLCLSVAFTAVAFLAHIGLAAISTPKKAVVTEYHGVKVSDSYQWLESANDPTVQKWTDQQNRAARAYLDKLPTREALQYQLQKLFDVVSADYSSLKVAQGKVF